jgi:hypothetical protein
MMAEPSASGELHSSNEWVHVTSHDSSSTSISAYDREDGVHVSFYTRNMEMEIDKALEKLEHLRCRSTMHGCQEEEYIVEKNAQLLGEAVFEPSILPSTRHAYSAIATCSKTRVLWVSPEVFHASMSSNAALHRTVSLQRCRRRSTIDTISGLCLLRDMIM